MVGAERPEIEELRRRRALVQDLGRPEAVVRQHALGKLTARERIDRLVDEGTFREFGALVDAARGTPGQERLAAPGDGVVTGVGELDGRPVSIMSFDFSVFGGSNGTTGGLKVARCCERSLQEGIPLVMLLDGGGHRIQEGLDSHHFAFGFDVFQQMVDLSGYVPVVAVMLGPGFGGPTNFAALADYTVMVRGISTMGIAGPALVAASTGEKLTKEELGGADLQARLGLADLAVDIEGEALDAVRVFLGYLPSSADQRPPHDEEPQEGDPPVAHLVPASTRQAYDVLEVVDALADPETAFEVKPEHAPNIVTALARIGGRPIGIVANQPMHLGGALDSPACEKAAHFVSLCDAFGVPLLFLIDVPGFLAGTESATTQLGRRSGRLLFELGQATVPRFSVVLRKGYGAGYIAMCGGRSFAADLALAWPTAEICAMSVEGAVDIAYRREVEAAPDPAARRAEMIAGFREQIGPFLAAQGFGIDDVVDPDETRALLRAALRRAQHRRKARAPRKQHAVSPI
ncbi:methylmalonyl-CoA carboxyltransferase [Pseudonocardia sp. RS11V-5]|uniref:acyl-CoA carboxylase subunit beta n=1 Tax=Pseudonocardia terrae TaxID=2905831 RepID=UPI001E6462B2|nr:carboxyl transferase domain-containing protein [Pseudonocardia terrae]MCE3554661.1 methylmalonyl-CoA carboxyltransferase [Pseudonocardia terrae]